VSAGRPPGRVAQAREFDLPSRARSRVAHRVDFPDYGENELLAIGETMLAHLNYQLTDAAREPLARYIAARRNQLHFANAGSIRNALDRRRLSQANRPSEEARFGT
jgi:hypothetical protein